MFNGGRPQIISTAPGVKRIPVAKNQDPRINACDYAQFGSWILDFGSSRPIAI
jgi:hypothetical protein